MSAATSFVVYGRYSHEQTHHVVSRHRKSSAAWRAAHRAHSSLGGCAGGNMLAKVYRRLTAEEVRRYQEAVLLRDYYCRVARGVDAAEVEQIDGALYAPEDYWSAHRVELIPGGLGVGVK